MSVTIYHLLTRFDSLTARSAPASFRYRLGPMSTNARGARFYWKNQCVHTAVVRRCFPNCSVYPTKGGGAATTVQSTMPMAPKHTLANPAGLYDPFGTVVQYSTVCTTRGGSPRVAPTVQSTTPLAPSHHISILILIKIVIC